MESKNEEKMCLAGNQGGNYTKTRIIKKVNKEKSRKNERLRGIW